MYVRVCAHIHNALVITGGKHHPIYNVCLCVCTHTQVDIDLQLAKCISVALQAYTNFTTLVLQELNLYDEAVNTLAK